MSTTTPSIPTNAPEVQPTETAKYNADRAHDARATRGFEARSKAINYQDAFDAIEESLTWQTISKAEDLLSNTAQYLREGKPWIGERTFAAMIIDVAHAVLEAGRVISKEKDFAAGLVFGDHELVDPEELRTLRLKADVYDADVARQDAKRDEAFKAGAESMRLQFVEAAEQAAKSQRGPKSRKLRLVKAAPKSKRAPVSAKGARRAG